MGALQIARKTGKVQWKDIEKDMYFLTEKANNVVHSTDAEARSLIRGMTVKEYLRYLWNSPKRGQSPYKIFEKVLEPRGYDEDGNIVYYYNENVTFQKMSNDSSFDLKRL